MSFLFAILRRTFLLNSPFVFPFRAKSHAAAVHLISASSLIGFPSFWHRAMIRVSLYLAAFCCRKSRSIGMVAWGCPRIACATLSNLTMIVSVVSDVFARSYCCHAVGIFLGGGCFPLSCCSSWCDLSSGAGWGGCVPASPMFSSCSSSSINEYQSVTCAWVCCMLASDCPLGVCSTSSAVMVDLLVLLGSGFGASFAAADFLILISRVATEFVASLLGASVVGEYSVVCSYWSSVVLVFVLMLMVTSISLDWPGSEVGPWFAGLMWLGFWSCILYWFPCVAQRLAVPVPCLTCLFTSCADSLSCFPSGVPAGSRGALGWGVVGVVGWCLLRYCCFRRCL